MRLGNIAERLGCQLEGDPLIEISRVVGLEEAEPGDLTFLSNPRYHRLVGKTRASAIIIAKETAVPGIAALRTDNPYLAFARSIDLFYTPPKPALGIHPSALIASTARLGRNPSIGPFCMIADDVEIGDEAVLHSHVAIYPGARIGHHFIAHSHVSVREHTRIGHRVVLQNGVVIGGDGFGFAKTAQNEYQKITQSGVVVLEDDVEVQSNSTIDRAAIGETRIRQGVKVDNLVQVGHGSRIGEHSLLCSQVGLAGSTEVGSHVILTGQVGVAGHCKVGDNVIATAQTGIPSDVESGKVVSGYPAIDNKLWLKSSAVFSKLPEINRLLNRMKQQLDDLTSKTS